MTDDMAEALKIIPEEDLKEEDPYTIAKRLIAERFAKEQKGVVIQKTSKGSSVIPATIVANPDQEYYNVGNLVRSPMPEDAKKKIQAILSKKK